jgi:hypothetical protein
VRGVRAAVVRPGTLLAAAFVAVALGGAFHRLPTLVRAGHDYWTSSTPPLAEADIEPLRFFASLPALETAVRLIPPDETFAVVVGNDPPLDADTAASIQPIFRFWLLPRRYVANPRQAQWVITYHHSSESLPFPYVSETGLGPEANLLRIRS